ncbi:MAG TPA: UbiA-like polyprenyltransferase [Tepidisphaeraceae bacterium]|jgi:4-hydroxybenzoate polyprenyltransferase|nr:UbiA-like polyprenyltransferase [Tepidisphaeraceae bacterium]
MTSLPQKLSLFAADIKIAHTIFALPFAFFSTFLAAGGLPSPTILLLILGCMITARTVAMSANRILDAHVDSLNPRTSRRALPAGTLSPTFYYTMLFLSASSFILLTSSFFFLYSNPIPLLLSIPVLAFLSAYPYLKRFTRLCHYYLGAALALAPICAWIAVTKHLALPPFIMAAAVLTWTAGFDILYACQDYACDLAQGLHSIPSKLGIKNALLISRLTHTTSAALLLALTFTSPLLGPIYLTGATIACLLLLYEHSLVSPTDLSKLNLAFFTINGLISCLLATLGILSILLH